MDGRRGDAFHVLGIPVDSDPETVARSYRRLARVTHPDVSADPQAADRFADLTAAYLVASRAAAAREASLTSGTPVGRPTPSGLRRSAGRVPPIVAGPVLIAPSSRATRAGS